MKEMNSGFSKNSSKLSKFSTFNFLLSTTYGLTLIELVVAFALLTSVSVIGIVGFREYSESQKIQNSTLDVTVILQKAKSRAQSQVKPTNIVACQNSPLDGYEVRICNVPLSKCSGNGRYELHVVCGGVSGLLEENQLPSPITFENTTQPTYFFRVINGSVNSGSIILRDASSGRKTIQISGLGNINIL